jgi:hypothetical protein
MSSVMEVWAARTIGIVEGVRAEEIGVSILPDAPGATALNVGIPMGFPRLNSYVLIPNEAGATIGWVSEVRVERSNYPKRKGTAADFGLVDLPFPMRQMAVVPIGTLSAEILDDRLLPTFRLRRGVEVFPSVGETVLLPGPEQLKAIVQGESTSDRSLSIGTCPTGGGADVFVDPDKLFGRHLAVLGNTGSGKSCTVSGLIHWALDRSARATPELDGKAQSPNARFVILDPNGEYSKAFRGMGARLYQVLTAEEAQKHRDEGSDPEVHPFLLPAWMWNGEEWAAFTGAAPGVQRPLLFEALRRLRAGQGLPDTPELEVHHFISGFLLQFQSAFAANDHIGKGRREGVAETLLAFQDQAEKLNRRFPGETDLLAPLNELAEAARALEIRARGQQRDPGSFWHKEIEHDAFHSLISQLKDIVGEQGGSLQSIGSEDSPRRFQLESLGEMVAALASTQQQRDLSQFADTLRLRIQGLLHREHLAAIANPETTPELSRWLEEMLGCGQPERPTVSIIDLSLVPTDVLHIVVGTYLRLTFEALQRHRRNTGEELPTVLVLEEAHHFAHRHLGQDGASPAAQLCNRVIDRIAREGRKFGLGLVVSSQRPSELSPTLLSQCNTFLLHRIVNDEDQTFVRRLIPDGMRELLRELPSLPSRRAFLLGWAAAAPTMVDIHELKEHELPDSPDPQYWNTWTRNRISDVVWQEVAEAWQGASRGQEEPEFEDLF